jgi:hypothetical protein
VRLPPAAGGGGGRRWWRGRKGLGIRGEEGEAEVATRAGCGRKKTRWWDPHGVFLCGACGRGLSAEAYPERGLQLAASYSLSYLEFVTAISKLYTFESNICIYSFLFPKLISY